MPLDVPSATVLGAAVGAGVAGIINAFAQWRARKSEERRAFRQIVVTAAMEAWKHEVQIAEKMAVHSKQPVPIYPFDIELVRMLKLAEIVTADSITVESVRRKLEEVDAVSAAAHAEIEERPRRRAKTDAANS